MENKEKTTAGLASYARAQLGRPYWWGCFGQRATEELLREKRRQYPEHYTAEDFSSQLGQKVHDCCGLIKGYLWCDGPEASPRYEPSQDLAVAGLYSRCSLKGELASMPELPGVCLFSAALGHVGVYLGEGQVAEAMGHAYGVVKTRLCSRGWRYWGIPDFLSPSGPAQKPCPPAPAYYYNVRLPLIKPGMESEFARGAQRLLASLGYDCGSAGADGIMGPESSSALIKFQQDRSLEPDGELGIKSWTALLRA